MCIFILKGLLFFNGQQSLLWKQLLTKAGWEIFQVLSRKIAVLAGLVPWLWISQKVPFFLPFTPNNAPPEICHKGLFWSIFSTWWQAWLLGSVLLHSELILTFLNAAAHSEFNSSFFTAVQVQLNFLQVQKSIRQTQDRKIHEMSQLKLK